MSRISRSSLPGTIWWSIAATALFAAPSCNGGAPQDEHTDPADGGPDGQDYEPPKNYDLPFAYTVGTDSLVVSTPGGDVAVFCGPWGTHNPLATGHSEGDAKANCVGLPAIRREQLHEVTDHTGTPGVCAEGDDCGLLASDVVARAPTYIAPCDEFVIESIRLDDANPYLTGMYYSTQHR